jgi:hypothetical protein
MRRKSAGWVQFQKGLGSEKARQKHLFRLRWPEGFRCPGCEHGEAYFHRPRHLYHCKACGYQGSLTASTIFPKTRTPLTEWSWMIWLMGRQLPGLIEMDDTYFGAPKPGKGGRGAAGKAKVVVAVETPEAQPRFAAMRMVPRVSAPEIQALGQQRLAAEVVVKINS